MAKKPVKRKGKDTIRDRSPHHTRAKEMSNTQLLAATAANKGGAEKELARRASNIGEEGKKARQSKKAAQRDSARQRQIEKAAHHAQYSGDGRKMR